MNANGAHLLFMLWGNLLCGVSVGMFRFADFGIDPFNLGVTGLWNLIGYFDYGTLYLILCLFLLILDFFFLDNKKLGIGTVTNMFLVGYVIEASHWILQRIFSAAGLWLRIMFLILALLLLCFSSALYYVSDLGVSPYDAVPLTIAERTGRPFKRVRVAADCLCVVVGIIGHQRPGIATLLIAFGLGPLISAFRPLCRKLLDTFDPEI